MELMVIEVRGVPDNLSHDHMVNQLKIHFLRRSNHGEDVLIVLYPTSIRGQAYVVFESAKAVRVLRHPHVLELENRFYPLHVKQAHLSEVDMRAETLLNLNKFQRPADVLKLLDVHAFEVIKLKHDHFLLRGSFLSLKLLRNQLIQLLAQDMHPQSRSYSAPSEDYTAHVSQKVLNSSEHRAAPKFTSKYGAVNGDDMQAESWNSLAGASPPSLPIPKPTSLLYGDSSSGASPRNRYNSCDDSLASPFYSSRQGSSSSWERVSFPVDTDILTYALTHNQDSFKDIEKIYGTEMIVKDDVGFTTVTFLGKNCKKAEASLLDIIQQMASSLRIQEINLARFDHKKQAQIHKRIQQSKDLNCDVLIKEDGDIVKVVGSSMRSFDVVQMLLTWDDEHQAQGHRGRNMKRNSVLRRSSSLPRQCRLNGLKETEQGPSQVSERQSNVSKEYLPSYDQEGPNRGRTLKALGGSQHSPNEQANRTRSRSEVRNQNTVTRGQLQEHDEVLISGGEKKSTKHQVPNIFKQLGKIPSKNILDIKHKLHKNNK